MSNPRSLTAEPCTVLMVPGIGNSDPEHWQSQWETHDASCVRVQQREWDHPVRTEWCASLNAAVIRAGRDVVIVAHSLGCLLVAHWAAPTTATAIRGALLVAVPDPDGPSFPVEAAGFGTVPDAALRFPSIVVASSNDPYGSIQFAEYCASRWGSRFINMGAAGHINSSSNLGAWPRGLALLRELRDGG
jgi:uncharacterized protein